MVLLEGIRSMSRMHRVDSQQITDPIAVEHFSGPQALPQTVLV